MNKVPLNVFEQTWCFLFVFCFVLSDKNIKQTKGVNQQSQAVA